MSRIVELSQQMADAQEAEGVSGCRESVSR
jgi:hypothetical protein